MFNSSYRVIQLTTGLSFGIICSSGGGSDTVAVPWTSNSTSVPSREPESVAGSSLVYYYNSDDNDRELVFQYYNSSMNGNYTCHTSTGSLSVIIEEGEKRREREREGGRERRGREGGWSV